MPWFSEVMDHKWVSLSPVQQDTHRVNISDSSNVFVSFSMDVNQKGVDDTEMKPRFIWHTQFSIAQSQQCFCSGTSGWVAMNMLKWWNTLFILFTFFQEWFSWHAEVGENSLESPLPSSAFSSELSLWLFYRSGSLAAAPGLLNITAATSSVACPTPRPPPALQARLCVTLYPRSDVSACRKCWTPPEIECGIKLQRGLSYDHRWSHEIII